MLSLKANVKWKMVVAICTYICIPFVINANEIEVKKKIIELTSPEQYVNLLNKQPNDEGCKELIAQLPFAVNHFKSASKTTDWINTLLMNYLNGESNPIKIEAIKQIGNLALKDYNDVLFPIYEKENQKKQNRNLNVQVEIIRTLGKIGGSNIPAFFQTILSSKEMSPVTEETLKAISKLCLNDLQGDIENYIKSVKKNIENSYYKDNKPECSPDYILDLALSVENGLIDRKCDK